MVLHQIAFPAKTLSTSFFWAHMGPLFVVNFSDMSDHTSLQMKVLPTIWYFTDECLLPSYNPEAISLFSFLFGTFQNFLGFHSGLVHLMLWFPFGDEGPNSSLQVFHHEEISLAKETFSVCKTLRYGDAIYEVDCAGQNFKRAVFHLHFGFGFSISHASLEGSLKILGPVDYQW